MEIRFSNERLELWEGGWSCPPTLRKRYSVEENNPHWEAAKFFMFIFFPLQSFVNAFTSSYYFYVNVGNMHTKIIPLNTRYSIIKKYEKLRQILIISQSLIKVRFKGKGSSRNHTKLNRFIYIKNIAVTLWICFKIVVTIVILIKCVINLPFDRSIKLYNRHCGLKYFQVLN